MSPLFSLDSQTQEHRKLYLSKLGLKIGYRKYVVNQVSSVQHVQTSFRFICVSLYQKKGKRKKVTKILKGMTSGCWIASRCEEKTVRSIARSKCGVQNKGNYHFFRNFGSILNQGSVGVVAKFSHGVNFWVRCASGNVFVRKWSLQTDLLPNFRCFSVTTMDTSLF